VAVGAPSGVVGSVPSGRCVAGSMAMVALPEELRAGGPPQRPTLMLAEQTTT
jgi:O-methyltransferase involved in polyketide biosynthesis